MTKKNLWLRILAIVLAFTMTAVGCNDDSTDDDKNGNGGNTGSSSVPEADVQVYNKDGTPYAGNGTVKYKVFNGGMAAKYIAVGTVTNGKLTLALPSSSDMSQFLGGTKTDLIYDSLVLESGTTSVNLSYSGKTEKNYFSVGFKYSTSDLKYDASPGATYHYDIKAGWVKLLTIQPIPPSQNTYTSTISGLPSNMKWTLNN